MLTTGAYTAVVWYEGRIGTFTVLYNRFRNIWHKRGFLYACCAMMCLCWMVFWSPVFSAVRGRRTFVFRGRRYRYFCHWYNTTFDNERAVELALALDALASAAGKRVLEVGNVLSHYVPVFHDVLDKYEEGEGIIHEDIVTFRPSLPYDLILSLSTIEHVGFDEYPQDSEKTPRAIENMRRCLAPGGYALITIPVAYNPHMDALLRAGMLFIEQTYLKRISRNNRWVETTADEALAAAYNAPYSFGNALVVCGIRRGGDSGICSLL